MPLYALGDREPTIHPDAYVHPDATVIGDVRLGAFATVWPQAVLRGDTNRITVGARTSVQDGTVIHCARANPTDIGDECVVGHNVHIEGAVIGKRTLVASGSVVLNGTVVGQGCVIGAGAVLAFNSSVPDASMVLGVPGRVRDGYVVPEGYVNTMVESYVERGKWFRADLRRLD